MRAARMRGVCESEERRSAAVKDYAAVAVRRGTGGEESIMTLEEEETRTRVRRPAAVVRFGRPSARGNRARAKQRPQVPSI